MAKNSQLIIGIHPIEEALDSGENFDKLFLQKNLQHESLRKIFQLAKEREIPVQQVPRAKLDVLCGNFSRQEKLVHQGIIGMRSLIQYYSIEDILNWVYQKGNLPLFIVLDGVTDVRNFGAIARSALSFNAHGLIIGTSKAAPINAEAIKASAGALNKIHVCRVPVISKAVEFLKLNGIKVYGADANASQNIKELPGKDPIAIVMGAEGSGISTAVANKLDGLFKIPMSGEFESLNVSVSAGIILYDIAGKRIA